MLCEPAFREHRHLGLLALAELSLISDYRLDKISLALGGDRSTARLALRGTETSDALFGGRLCEAARSLRTASPTAGVDPWHIVYASAVGAHSRNPTTFGRARAFGVERLLSSILSHDTECLTNRGQLEKLSNIFDAEPAFGALGKFLSKLLGDEASQLMRVDFVSLNSPTIGVEDLALAADENYPPLEPRLQDLQCPSAQVWRPGRPAAGLAMSDPVSLMRRFASGLRLLRAHEAAEALPLLHGLANTPVTEPLRHLITTALLVNHHDLGDRLSTIALIAREAARNDLTPALLPIDRVLKPFSWSDYRPLADCLAASVVLDTLWRRTEDDSIATMLRFSFAYQLQRSGCKRPSEFVDHASQYDCNLLLYYLRNVCVPPIMDMSRAFKSSRQVTEERQAVCASLKVLDPERANEYDGEIFSISNSLVVQDGLKLVDRSRIHVDLDAVARWARRAIAEDFARYADLVAAGVGARGDFGEILREISATIGARQVFFTPDDQSDAILADMLERTRDVFLSNSDYGLDFFLSKRVRHQSFVGLIRGPLEFANLITTRESEFGPYRENDVWLAKFDLDGDDRERLASILSRFSEQFDTRLSNLKDRYFQIQTADIPDGLFRVTLTSQMLLVLRQLMQAGLTFEEFLRGVFGMFWGALEPSLAEARAVISTELKTQLSDLFTGLRENVRNFAEWHPAFPEFSATVGDASAEVQRSLDQAAAWFVRPEGQPTTRQFTLKQSVEIAVDSAKNSHRAFDPDLSVDVEGTVDLDAADLLLITDTIFIALDNVKRHSGIHTRPRVRIRCKMGEEERLVYLEVVSAMSRSKMSETEEKLNAIRSLIMKGELGKRARREGRSGFLKLASDVRQSAAGTLDFGLTEVGDFRLALCFRPTQYTVAFFAGS